MSTTEYASAVAEIRAMESSLLSYSDIERMIGASNLSEVSDILTSCGREPHNDLSKLQQALDNELEEVWNSIHDFIGENEELNILLYKNDFHNLKAAMKALIMNVEPQRYFLKPTVVNLDELPAIVANKRYDELPWYMREPAEKAYEVLTRTLDGQLADAILDTSALNAMQNSAMILHSDFMQKYAQLITVCSDIKTSYRCSRLNKSENFLETALCGSSELDKTSLLRASISGTDGFISFLENSSYYEAAEKLKVSTVLFEKWCDDLIMSYVKSAKMKCFGIEPLAAYYIAKETEIKNLRILLVCKNCGVSNEKTMERMRRLYV